MKYPIMFALSLSLTFFSFSLAHAQEATSKPTDMVRILNQIDEDVTFSDNLINSLEITFSPEKVSFPDYPKAHAQFLSESTAALSALKKSFSDIRAKISVQISNMQSDKQAYQDFAAEKGDKQSSEILNLEKDALKKQKDKLFNDVNEIYQNALINVFSVSGRLVFPVKSRDNFGRKGMGKSQKDDRVQKIFNNCTTAGCTLYMTKEYVQWEAMVRVLNKDIDLIEGLKLEAINQIDQDDFDEKLNDLAQYHCTQGNLEPGLVSEK